MGIHELLSVAQSSGIGEKKDIEWYLGYVAQQQGIPLGRNPFHVENVQQWQNWREGWSYAAHHHF